MKKKILAQSVTVMTFCPCNHKFNAPNVDALRRALAWHSLTVYVIPMKGLVNACQCTSNQRDTDTYSDRPSVQGSSFDRLSFRVGVHLFACRAIYRHYPIVTLLDNFMEQFGRVCKEAERPSFVFSTHASK